MSCFDNIILGGGPAGLQCAYFFQNHKINYLILEKNNKCGSFFDQYPHSGKLISINKKYTGIDSNNEFKLRHDWNSLLNDDGLLFTDYSDDYYPDKKDLVKYLNDYANKYKLNINYDSDVEKISKTDDKYFITPLHI
jgi:protoporphyrinogen oxidase